jgi:hypothetical protein
MPSAYLPASCYFASFKEATINTRSNTSVYYSPETTKTAEGQELKPFGFRALFNRSYKCLLQNCLRMVCISLFPHALRWPGCSLQKKFPSWSELQIAGKHHRPSPCLQPLPAATSPFCCPLCRHAVLSSYLVPVCFLQTSHLSHPQLLLQQPYHHFYTSLQSFVLALLFLSLHPWLPVPAHECIIYPNNPRLS